MSLLDDLKQQAGKKQSPQASEQTSTPAEDGDFYREHAKARMLAAYEFLTELVNQLNEIKLDTRAEYPFKPEGKPVALMQQDYKAFNDSITDPRQITLSFNCSLVNPTSYEVKGRAAVLAQSELLDRYRFKYEKIEQKDARQMVAAAQFRLIGPLAIKIMLQVDDSRRVIKLILANFVGPGASQYHLKPEQLDEAFLDHLGKYILRQETTLFKEELSEDMRAKLRQKLQEEQRQREAELQEIEAARQAEEVLRKQNSTTTQLKKAVSQRVTGNTEKLKKAMNGQLKRAMHTQVARGKDSLKGMFDKLKKKAQAPQQTPPVQPAAPAARVPPTKSAQPHPQATAKTRVSAQANTRLKPGPLAPESTAERARVASAPAGMANSKPASPASPGVVKTATVKRTQPPKVYNAPPNNPFLKPEPPVDAAEQEEKTVAAQPDLEPIPVADRSSRPDEITESLKADTAEVKNTSQTNPFLKSASPVEPLVDAAEQEANTATAQPALEPTMIMDISSHPGLKSETLEADRGKVNSTQQTNPFLKQASPVESEPPASAAEQEEKTVAALLEPESTPMADRSSVPDNTAQPLQSDLAKVNNAPQTNPHLKPASPVESEPPASAAEQEEKTVAAPLELEPTPVADSAYHQEVTPESLEADLARIIERDKQNKPQQKAAESKTPTQNPFLKLEERDLDIYDDVTQQNHDS